LKHFSGRKYSFLNLNQFSPKNNKPDHAPSNIDGFLSRDTQVGSCQVNSLMFSTLKAVFPGRILSNYNSFLTGKQNDTCSSFKHRLYSLQRYMCFFNLAEQGYLQQTEPISTLNMLAENTP
jgi:hypothetical protein